MPLPNSGSGLPDFWSVPADALIRELQSSPAGLAEGEARCRLSPGCSRLGHGGRWSSTLALLAGQLTSLIVLVLVAAAVLSMALGQATDALIILAIVAASGLLGFWQE
jgi:Mg2+-importing ATPase